MKGRLRRILSIAVATALGFSMAASPIHPAPVRADDGLSISGNVVGSSGHLGGISVSACTENWSACSGTTYTDDSGNFSLTGLGPGRYIVTFDPTPYYLWGVYAGPGLTSNYWSGTRVEVTAGNVTLTDVQLATAYFISGTVTGAAGGLGGIQVFACPTDGSGCASTTVDEGGHFSVGGLAPKTYDLRFDDQTRTYATNGVYTGSGLSPDPSAAAPILVTDGDVTLPSFELPLGVSISGTVTGSAGNLGGIWVTACSVAYYGCGDAYADDGGSYTVRGLFPGAYQVYFYDGTFTYISGNYTDTGLVQDTTVPPVMVGADGITLSTIQLEVASTISGMVTGDLLPNIFLETCPAAPSPTWGYCSTAYLDGSGQFMFTGLAAGSYTIRIRSFADPSTIYYYSDSGSAVLDPSQATAIAVPPSVSGLTVLLSSPGPATAPAAPTGVMAIPGDGSAALSWVAPSDGGSTITSYTVTASDGLNSCVATTTTCTVSGLVNGAAYTFTVTATNAVGTGPVSDASNEVTPVGPPVRQAQSISFDPLADTVYGAAPIALNAVASSGLPVSLSAGGACTVVGSTVLVTGAGSCGVIASQSGDAHWLAADPVIQSFWIAPAHLSISASSVARPYGSGNPAFTPSYSGFVNGDTAANLTALPTCTTTATASSPTGTYPITCSGASAYKYAITYTDGALTITHVQLTVSAPSATRAYGAANPAFAPTYSGFVNGDTAASLTALPTCTTTATPSSPVGTYPITCSGASTANYAIAYADGALTIAIADRFATPTNATLDVAAPGVLALINAPGSAVVVSSQPAGKLTLGSGGAFTYVPKSNFSGSDSFTYRLNVGGNLSAPVTVTIYVVGSGMNCSGCNLSGLNLSGVSLGGANLSLANLAGTELNNANLRGANLSKATLTGADLTGANLTGANLTGATLSGATLSGATVKGVSWSNSVCPDGSDSAKDGGTCVGHLNP